MYTIRDRSRITGRSIREIAVREDPDQESATAAAANVQQTSVINSAAQPPPPSRLTPESTIERAVRTPAKPLAAATRAARRAR